MIKIQQRFPAYMDFDPAPPWTFDSVAEMCVSKELEAWHKGPGFDHFAVSGPDYEGDGRRLMAVLDKGKTWWVIAYILEGDVSELPKWECPE